MKELIYWQQVRDYDLGKEAERALLLTWSRGNAGMILGKELLHFAQEIVSPLLEEAPMDFFHKWLQTTFMHWVGADPFRRGTFAREAGFTEHELGLWNRLHTRHSGSPTAATQSTWKRRVSVGQSYSKES